MMIDMNKFVKFFIIFLVAVAVLGSSMYVYSLTSSAQADTFSYSLVNSDGDFKVEYYVSSSAGGEYSWVDYETVGGSMEHSFLTNPDFYRLRFTQNNSYYIGGVRIWGVMLADYTYGSEIYYGYPPSASFTFQNVYNLFDNGVSLSSLSLKYYGSNHYDWERYFTYGKFAGVSSYNQFDDVLNISVNLDYTNEYSTQYEPSDTTYDFNSYFELAWEPVKLSSSFLIDFIFSYSDTASDVTPFDTFATNVGNGITDVADYLKDTQTFYIIDFINGSKVGNLVGNNVATTFNPFLSLFFGNGMNSTWLALCSFSFGFFVLIFLIAMLRRAKK